MPDNDDLVSFTEQLINTALNDDRYCFTGTVENSIDFNNAEYAHHVIDYLGGGFAAALIFDVYKSPTEPGYGSASINMPLDAGMRYYQHYAQTDARVQTILDMGPHKTAHHNFTKKTLNSTNFIEWLSYCELEASGGITHCFTTPSDGLVTGLTVFPKKGVKITDEHIKRVNQAARISKSIHDINIYTSQILLHKKGYEQAISERENSCIILDREGKVLFHNESIKDLMDSEDIFTYTNERISLKNPEHNKSWEQRISSITNRIQLADSNYPLFIPGSPFAYHIRFYALPYRSSIDISGSPVALIEIQKIITQSSSVSATEIKNTFELLAITQKEAEVIKFVLDGYPTKLSVDVLFKTPEAVQKSLQKIHTKLGTKNKNDILRLLSQFVSSSH